MWRPLGKVKSWPLALCDARTLKADDLVTCDIVRRRYVGETYFGKYNPDQRWHYLSDMDFDDVILLKVYDSDSDVAAKRESVPPPTPSLYWHFGLTSFAGCLHASFPLEGAGRDVLRESIELRILAFTES